MLWISALIIGALVWLVVPQKHTARRPTRKTAESARLRGNGEYEIEIVGESYYQEALERICGGKTEEGVEKFVEAAIHLEDGNKHDNKAVRVEIEGQLVGYLSREHARAYRNGLAAAGHTGIIGLCAAVIRGGWQRKGSDTGLFGVRLDLSVD